jgi:hypothetical protein
MLSDVACDDTLSAIRQLLVAGVEADRLICPASPGGVDETLAAEKSWRDISDLQDQLSMGVFFLDDRVIAQREVFDAAANFCGDGPFYSLADEAFDDDPHTPRDDLFPGGLRVRARFGPSTVRNAEVAHEKAKEAMLQAAYDEARRLGRTFEEQADAEFGAMLNWVLGPLVDPNFEAELARKQARVISSPWWSPGPGTPTSQFIAVSQRGKFAEALVETFPALAERAKEFVASDELAHMPALRYPPLLRAGLATMPGRKFKQGDGYDIVHLTCGLSRCDIVTADGGMTELVRGKRLVPEGCQVFSRREVDKFHGAIEAALAANP